MYTSAAGPTLTWAWASVAIEQVPIRRQIERERTQLLSAHPSLFTQVGRDKPLSRNLGGTVASDALSGRQRSVCSPFRRTGNGAGCSLPVQRRTLMYAHALPWRQGRYAGLHAACYVLRAIALAQPLI